MLEKAEVFFVSSRVLPETCSQSIGCFLTNTKWCTLKPKARESKSMSSSSPQWTFSTDVISYSSFIHVITLPGLRNAYYWLNCVPHFRMHFWVLEGKHLKLEIGSGPVCRFKLKHLLFQACHSKSWSAHKCPLYACFWYVSPNLKLQTQIQTEWLTFLCLILLHFKGII